MLRQGEVISGGFRVAEARPGYFEVVLEDAGGRKITNYTASSEKAVLDRVASFIVDQARRKHDRLV